MADEETEIDEGTDEIDVNITIVDDVNEIPKNKHETRDYNYGSGVVSLKCLINGRCPLIRQPLVDNSLVFNFETLKGFPEEDLQNLSAVVNDDGIYLAEKYIYRSTFLFINDEEVVPTGQGGANSTFSDNEDVVYREEQTFVVENSVFDSPEKIIPKPSEYLKQDTSSTHTSGRWIIVREKQHTDYEGKGSKVANTNKYESGDSMVWMPSQVASSPNTKDCKNITAGIHWRVVKKTPLFKGEDFFIEFNTGAIARDFQNVKSKKFVNSDYNFLDSVQSLKGSMEVMPANAGVVSYEMGRDENGNPNGGWKKIPESTQYLDLNRQSYYVIEIGTDNGVPTRYFIILTQKSKPYFVKVIDGRSYFLSQYAGISGEDLFKSSKIRLTLRNHLGKFVITFMGLEDVPWIISDRKVSENDKAFLQVPESPISIWGGNIAARFSFGPLQYISEYELELPQSKKFDENPKNPVRAFKGKDPYELPLIGTAYNVALLSVSDGGLDSGIGFSKPEDNNSSSSGEIGNSSDSELGGISSNSYLENREPMFSADMQYSLEAKVNISDGSVGSVSQFEQPEPTYFLNTGDYIKAGQAGASKKPPKYIASRIELQIILKGENKSNTQRYMQFYLKCKLVAGHHKFKGSGWKLESCKTPVLTIIRLVCIPDNQVTAWTEEPVDVSKHVLSFSDSWSSQDFHTMEHTGSISFLINKGLGIPDNQSEFLQSVQSKAFYIEVWAGYIGCNYSQLDGAYKLFTGLCMGGIITEEAGKRILDCQIFDYSKICQETYIFNSPFFDGMRDLNAMNELSQMIGFRADEGSPSAPDPGYLVRMAAETSTNDNLTYATPDGRGYETKPYALPASYSRLLQPFLKFTDGSTFWENMQSITQKAGKVIFFDAYGMLHYEYLPFTKFMFGNMNPADVESLWKFVSLSSEEGQQIFNTLTRERAAGDMFNSINIMTSTPDYELIINSDVNWESISDPNSPGFLGYKKIFFQQDGIFGSLKSTKDLINHYKIFYKAPIVYKFETYGQPLRCFDIADVDGQKLIITSVSSEINPAENRWWQNIEGEWYHGET